MREACPRNNELVSACSASWLYAKTAANAIVLAARFFAGTEQGSPAKSTLVYEDVIPRFTPYSAVSYSLSISGFGNGEEISTCVILLSGSRLASEFHLLPGIGARAEKQDPRDLTVNIDVVKALIEIVRCSCCRLPAVRYFLWSKQ